LFKNSPISKKLFEYFERKFYSSVAPKALAKCAVLVSSRLERPRFSLIDVGQSRSLKSYTSNEVMKIFDKDFYIDLGSDFTIPSLHYYENEMLKGISLMVNDATTLFSTKTQKSKDRIVSAFSELLADGKYVYQNFDKNNKFILQGKVTAIINITNEAFETYKDRLFGLTFAERFLILHHTLTQIEKEEWVSKQEFSQKRHYPERITVDDIEKDVDIPQKFFEPIKKIAKDYAYLSMRTFVGVQDLIKGTMKAHASLNKRKEVCTDDLQFVLMLKPYLVNPFNPEGMIVKLRAQGLSFDKICLKIGRTPNYRQQVERVLEKAKIRGILDA
jgi:hypothetical protein